MAGVQQSEAGVNPAGGQVELPALSYRIYILVLLTIISAISAIDRQILDILIEPIRNHFSLSDGQMGALNGLAYAGIYSLAVIPLARVADKYPRRLVIAVCVFFWSLATTVSSYARSYGFLFAARMGVGLGEAGLSPTGPAMLSDLFPRHQRGTVTSFYMTGAAIGMGLAYAIGGWAVENFGWRSAFLVAGVPGLVMAPLFFLTVRNFPKGMADGLKKDPPQPALGRTFRAITTLRTIGWMVVGLATLGMMVSGVQRWIPAYLERIEGVDAITFGAALGSAVGIGSFTGHLLGGPLADFVGRRDMRLQFMLGVVAAVGAAIVIWAMLNSASLPMFYVLAGMLTFFGGIFAAPLIMICTTLPPVWARATTTAIALMATNLIGYGVGPAVIGVVSDAFVPAYGENSLRAALLSTIVLAVPTIFCFYMASRHYRADLEASAEQLARDAELDKQGS